MRFSKYRLSDSLEFKRADICHMMKMINPRMTETLDDVENAIHIMVVPEVLANVGSTKFIISDTVLKEMIDMEVREIPVTSERRQVISMCFAPLWVSSVGFNQSYIVDCAKKVSLLGGIFTRGFSENVTIVIAATNASPKVFDARKNRVPVVTEEWLTKCFETMTRVPLEPYYLPPFEGLVITSSDLPSSEHKRLRKLVRSGGGTWSDVFDSEVTLILANHLSTTKKIELALDFSVPIVKPSFITSPDKFEALNWWSLTPAKSKLFEGMKFLVHKECACFDGLQLAIEAHSGIIGESPTHVVVPHGTENSFRDVTAVTPYWIWACIESKSVLPLNTSVMYSPLPYKGPISKLAGKVFYLELKENEDTTRHVLGDMIRFCGGSVVYKVTDNISYAIGTSSSKTLMNIAMNMNIPVVKPSFVFSMVSTGSIPDYRKFVIDEEMQSKILSKLCRFIRNVNLAREEQETIEISRADLESFTQEFDSTPNEFCLEVGYGRPSQRSGRILSNDPLLELMDS